MKYTKEDVLEAIEALQDLPNIPADELMITSYLFTEDEADMSQYEKVVKHVKELISELIKEGKVKKVSKKGKKSYRIT